MAIMFLRSKVRRKDGKSHRYWSVVENRRIAGKRVVQKQVLYLGELNDAQRAGWVRTIETFEDQTGSKGKKPKVRQLALFPDDRRPPDGLTCEVAQIRLDQIQLRRPRQWGAYWLAMHLWDMLDLDTFWKQRLGVSRKKTDWTNVLKALSAYRFIAPGSEWRFHREWFDNSAMADLLDEDFSIAQKDKPYRLLDRLIEHRDDLFSHLKNQWGKLFNVGFDVLLYDLSVRPIYHQLDTRIEAHIFVSFLAYCFHTTLRQMSRVHAGGLTGATIIEKFQSVQMIDIHLPTTDGRRIVLSRHTEPEPDIQLLLSKLDLILPPQPPSKISAHDISSVVPT